MYFQSNIYFPKFWRSFLFCFEDDRKSDCPAWGLVAAKPTFTMILCTTTYIFQTERAPACKLTQCSHYHHLCMVTPFPPVQREPPTLLGEKSLFPTEMTQIKGLFSPCSWVCCYTHLLYICATRSVLRLQTHRLLLAEHFIENASRCLLKASRRAAPDLDSSLLYNLLRTWCLRRTPSSSGNLVVRSSEGDKSVSTSDQKGKGKLRSGCSLIKQVSEWLSMIRHERSRWNQSDPGRGGDRAWGRVENQENHGKVINKYMNQNQLGFLLCYWDRVLWEEFAVFSLNWG